MKKDPYVFIDHIRESIEAIEAYTQDVSREQFLNNPQIQDAVCRRLEIIGEAANKLESEFTEKFPLFSKVNHIPDFPSSKDHRMCSAGIY